MLPLIKDTIKAIKQVYNPIGFALYSVAGDESKPHFHLHIIPKYKKNYGPCRSKKKGELLPDRKAAYEEAAKRLEAKDGILGENNKAISKLASQEESLSKSHIIIKAKKSISNDIQKIDQEN